MSSDPQQLFAPNIPDDSIWAIARNGVRHLVEADQHFKAERYASALASAVFSIEEIGKAHAVALTGKPLAKGGWAHRAHQLPFIAALQLVLQSPWLAHWQKALKQGLTADDELSSVQQADAAAHPEIAEFVAALRAGKFETPEERVKAWAEATGAKNQRDGTTDFWKPFFEGAFQKLRLRATYVDVSPETGLVVSDPSIIDRDDAELTCTGALGMVLVTFKFTLGPLRLAEHQKDFEAMLPTEEMTGAAHAQSVQGVRREV